MTAKKRDAAGFTLIELLVVVLIIGILTALAVPSYMKSVETSKADDAVSLTNMIGTTNKMFALDHSGAYVSGTFPTGSNGSCASAGVTACPAAGPYSNACHLVACKYLADQNFGSKPYTFYACDPGIACNGAAARTASAQHKASPAAYAGWGYAQDTSGVITNLGGAPAPSY